jgi:hypothetical protein
VLAKKEHFYKVKLSASIKIHLIFLAESLCYNLNNSLLSQANTSLLPINITADNKYKVQKIIAIKLTKEKLTYQAK